MKFPLIDFFVDYVGIWWAAKVEADIGRFVEKGERVLDIGAGIGVIGELLSKNRLAAVTLLDVARFNRSKLPLVLYDGRTIPFPEASFDTSLLSFALHHCQDPLQVLREAARVSRKRIIIYEDTFDSRLERFLTCANDFIANLHLFLVNPFKINMPYNYRKVEDWEKLFKDLGLQVRFSNVTKHFMTKHVLFVLDK